MTEIKNELIFKCKYWQKPNVFKFAQSLSFTMSVYTCNTCTS